MPHWGKVEENLKRGFVLGYPHRIFLCSSLPFPPIPKLDCQKESWGFLGGLGASEQKRTSAEALYPGAGCCTQQVLLEEVEGADLPLGGP